MNDPPWFSAGLRFSCTRCGACCAGTPGYVWVGPEEIERLASHLGLSVAEFGSRYLRLVNGRISLTESREDACVFWDPSEGCRVYEARPEQCRTWPFWRSTLTSPEAWEQTRAVCPGAGSGDLVPLDSILQSLASHPR